MEIVKKHPIGVVQRQTGLSTHVIRKWEERYQAIVPRRDENGRRFYSSDDINRLQLLKQAITTGRTIGQVVHVPNSMLSSFIEADKLVSVDTTSPMLIKDDIQDILNQFLSATKDFQDATMLEILNQAYVHYGLHEMMDSIIPHIMRTIGTKWHKGELRIVQEHMATFRISSFLMRIYDDLKLPESAPVALSATLHDQHHTIGSLIAAIIARDAGYKALYVGGNIPAVEIASAVNNTHATLLMLSFNYPYNQLNMNSDLTLIKQSISKDIDILIGGSSALQYTNDYKDKTISYSEDFSQLRSLLETISRTH